MDPVSEIKARLPIDELVSRYCMLKRKGKSFVALCPFHNDTHPSLLISPDKGIAYCFACQTGGDIFSFYQAIEGVDFRQALRDLAERTGVPLRGADREVVKQDEKERARACLEAALRFYQEQLRASSFAQEYVKKRGVPAELIEKFELGYAPDSFSATYEHLLKAGFSRSEILRAGLGVQKDLQDERIYDRFRHRLMFPIADHQGALVGFGGRTLGDDEAKYVNSAEGILYHKSRMLFGLHHAREAMRERKKPVILVEGYFDVLACHKVGITNVVAVSGTALTEQHASVLKRYAEVAILCLDQDRAGQEAAERAFQLLSRAGLSIQAITLTHKDPDEAVTADPESLKNLIEEGGKPYLDVVLNELNALDLSAPLVRRQALKRLLLLLSSLTLAVERQDYVSRAAVLLRTTDLALEEDLRSLERIPTALPPVTAGAQGETPARHDAFSQVEVTLGLFLLYPRLKSLLPELIPPDGGFSAALYRAITSAPEGLTLSLENLDLTQEEHERAALLLLFHEYHGFSEWAESMATREIRRNCRLANREAIRVKQREISKQLLEARAAGRKAEEEKLHTQYQQVLRLAKMAS